MRKILFFLICAVVVGCNSRNEPEKKTTEKKATKTADLVVKYYLNDSLLHYVNFSIVDSLHLSSGPLPYSTAPLDTLGADAAMWQGNLGISYRANKSLYTSIPPSTIKVITLSRHLEQGSYSYCLRFTQNNQAPYSGTIPILIAQTSTASLKKWNNQTQNEVQVTVAAKDLMSQLQRIQAKMKTTVSF